MIGYHMSSKTLANSSGEVVYEGYLAWLAERPEAIGIFYNLNYAVAQLAKICEMRKEEGVKLLASGRLYFPPFGINYISNKFFSVKHGFFKDAPFASYADASQYDKSGEIKADDSPAYCIARAKEAQDIGQRVYDTLVKIGLHPTTVVSPVSAYQKEVLSNLPLPTVDDMPAEVAEISYGCCHGNWVEAFARGHWGEKTPAYDYDVVSAYPYWASQLLDVRYGEWHNFPLFMPSAVYGFCRGTVTINKPFSPIIYGDESNYTPVGTWECSLTKREIEFINRYELGEFQIKNGWWWVPRKEVRPLKSAMERLFAYKESFSGFERDVAKRVMSGIYGKFLELRHSEFGPLFNSVWGAEIEANTRLQVGEFCMKAMEQGIDVIHIAVDGVTLSAPIQGVELGDKMGDWKLSSECPCLCISSGVLALREKYGGLDFSLDYDYLMRAIEKSPKGKSIAMKKQSFVSIVKAVQTNQWDKLGELETLTRTIDLGYEMKRVYRDNPKCGADLLANKYVGEPIDVSMAEL